MTLLNNDFEMPQKVIERNNFKNHILVKNRKGKIEQKRRCLEQGNRMVKGSSSEIIKFKLTKCSYLSVNTRHEKSIWYRVVLKRKLYNQRITRRLKKIKLQII